MTRKTGSPLLAARAARQGRSGSSPHPHLPFLKALSHRCHQCSAPNPGDTALARGQRIEDFFFFIVSFFVLLSLCSGLWAPPENLAFLRSSLRGEGIFPG